MDTKALRQKILDLAIRGKLVPQDPNDEPASVLLERIRQQKQQMVKEGKLKPKDIKNDSVIFVGEDNLHYEKFTNGSVKCIEDEIPFDLPEGWAWAFLSNIVYVLNGDRGQSYPAKSKLRSKGIPFVSASNIQDGVVSSDGLLCLSDSQYDALGAGKLFAGDIVYCIRGSLGKCGLFTMEKGAIASSLVIVRSLFDAPHIIDYIFLYLNSALAAGEIKKYDNGSAQPNLAAKDFRHFLVPLPPQAEMQRINKQAREALVFVKRIQNNKDELHAAIAVAKSKILDLAIHGQLVPQDPADEPASVLLDRIRTEREELIRQGKIKRDKKESVIFRGEDNSYYLRTGELVESLEDWDFEELPDSWSVCCLGELCDYGNCTNIDTADIADSAWILDLEDIEKNSGIVLQKVRQGERNAGSTKHRFHKGQVLYSKLRPYLNKVVLADEDGYCTSEILPLEFERNILPQYARYFLMSPAFLRYANKCSYGVKMPRLGTTDGKKAIISVPPVKEQKRIIMAIELAFAQLASIAENLA